MDVMRFTRLGAQPRAIAPAAHNAAPLRAHAREGALAVEILPAAYSVLIRRQAGSELSAINSLKRVASPG